MHFKSLELIGFKSFAEKTKLDFEPGVTAIVGPNGCGKSNIADSIRWVLGEQSAKSLRASKMEDVIFNGTDTKEPINFAEVSLTFSNENRILPIDYDEVTISRRVFRSGETEYLLNKTPVRLKDISELLMGTGIGTESYSIIEQGKMDLILSSRPEDRRYIFEEASGITKYKSKKKEALRKLEQTEQNLLRISDIILEVKRQISSIERQARKAERYKVDFDKLKEIEVKQSFFDFKSLKTQEKTYSVESGDLKDRERELDVQIQAVVADISGYRQSLDEINQNISEVKNKSMEVSGALDMNLHKIEIDKERIEEARATQGAPAKEIESITEKIISAKTLVDKLRGDRSRLESDRSLKHRSIEEKEGLLNNISGQIESTEEKVKICKVQIVDFLSRETKTKNELIKLGADIQNRNARQRRLAIEKETVLKELEAIDRIKQAITKDFADLEGRISSIKSELDTKKNFDKAILSEIGSLDARISQEENKKASTRSKIEFLEDLIKKYEGFNQGVKTLLVRMGSDTAMPGGILGALADIIKIESGYEEAVSTFLGDDVQTVITEKESDVTSAIEYLRNNKAGKASFLALETITRLNARVTGSRGISGLPSGLIPLREFVRSDAGHDATLDYFFANAFLTESLGGEVKDFADMNAATIVTKSGLKYYKGRFSGGSISDSGDSFLIGRRDRLDALGAYLKSAEDEIASLGLVKKEKGNAAEILKTDVASLEASLHAEEITLANIRVKKDAQEENTKKLMDELSVAELELDEVSQTIGDLSKTGEQLNVELNNMEKESAAMHRFIEESQVAQTENSTKRERLALEIATLRTEGQALDKEDEGLKGNMQKEEAFLYELEETYLSKEDLLKDSYDKAKGFADEIQELSVKNGSLSAEIESLNGELSNVEQGKAGLADRLGFGEMQLKDKDGEIESLRNQIRDMDVKLTELNYKKTNLRERINQSYKADLEEMHLEIEDNIDWESIKSQVAELKDKLEKMGPVNLIAIDEHKELEERYAFLVHQQEDLVNAKDSVLKAIQKINKTTKELFLDTFQKIQLEFKTFFKTLFGGGQAELILIDEQDVLESGIEIIVRPPGKKLQNLMLLSGGEKALTAIALLFSIFKVKPSPFCVLDEIDAPLDESNVTRFSGALKDFLKISQFIIITHNKRTMELADLMYGITMQERGVSKIVSVKFLDDRKEEVKETVPEMQNIQADQSSQGTQNTAA